jgi:Spy/CpxP family protein refolding chaperone
LRVKQILSRRFIVKRLSVVVFVLLLFICGLTGIIWAASDDTKSHNDGCQGMGSGHGKWMGQGMKSLNLTAEQKEKMGELRKRYHAATRDLRYDLAQKRLEMRRLFTDPKTSDQMLMAKEKELSALRQKLFDTRAQMKIEWRSILTPEQIQKLDTMPHRGRGHGFGFRQR